MASATQLLIIFLLFFSAPSFAHVIINEAAPPGYQWQRTNETVEAPMQTADDFSNMYSFKSEKKVGISTTVGGAMGLVGLSLNLNFTPETTFSIGSGMSQDFSALNMNIKTDLTSGAFQAYFVGGISRWFSNSRNSNAKNASPSFFYSKFLSPEERKTGVFAKNLVYPGLGLQYTDLGGRFEGFGIFSEVIALMDLSSLTVVPTAGLGAVYYF